MNKTSARAQTAAVLFIEGSRLVLSGNSGLALTDLVIGSEQWWWGLLPGGRYRPIPKEETSEVRQKDRTWFGACSG